MVEILCMLSVTEVCAVFFAAKPVKALLGTMVGMSQVYVVFSGCNDVGKEKAVPLQIVTFWSGTIGAGLIVN